MPSDHREDVVRLAALLRRAGDTSAADMVERALAGSAADFDAFLVSNELWGGAGSIADQGGLGSSRDARVEIEKVLIALGTRQVRARHVNVRTQMWVDAFVSWQS